MKTNQFLPSSRAFKTGTTRKVTHAFLDDACLCNLYRYIAAVVSVVIFNLLLSVYTVYNIILDKSSNHSLNFSSHSTNMSARSNFSLTKMFSVMSRCNSTLPKGYYVQRALGGINKKLNSIGCLKNKTVFISGGSRGIGCAIGIRAARDGANVVIAAKTVDPHPKLEGTIFTAAKLCQEAGGQSLAVECNLQHEESVKRAIDKTVETFGGIDILVNSASAIQLSSTEAISMKRYDLMHSINGRGTFMVTKYAIPHLRKSSNGHILTLAPPIDTVNQPFWFQQAGTAYTTAKLLMSMQVVGMAAELRESGVAVNALWPRTTIATAAVQNVLGGEEMMRRSRKTDIMGDAAHAILCSDAARNTGNFWIDDEVMVGIGDDGILHTLCVIMSCLMIVDSICQVSSICQDTGVIPPYRSTSCAPTCLFSTIEHLA
jgi:citronellol/citronellal dehydrogenase